MGSGHCVAGEITGTRLNWSAGPATATFGVLESVAFALGFQDVAAVGKPVQGRPGQAFAAEYLRPVLERQVGGRDQAVPLVGGGDHIEQEFRPGLAGGNVAQFVEDQQVQLAKLLPQPQELPLFFSLQEQGDELGDAEEADFAALGTGGHTQRRGHVEPAGSRGTDEQNVLPLVEIFPFDQFHEQRLVDARSGREVELIKRLMGWEAGGLQPSLDRLAFPFD